jgi:hypothetical protein
MSARRPGSARLATFLGLPGSRLILKPTVEVKTLVCFADGDVVHDTV